MNGRKDKILKTLKIMCQESNENNENLSGITAQMIAAATGIDRSNVSRELNALLLDGKVVKIKGRPTFYLEKHMLIHKYGKEHISDTFNSLDSLLAFVNSKDDSISINSIGRVVVQESSSPSSSFSHLIGEKESLKQQIKQAKAAILYPPNGLHMLILGETGIGKSTFVESIYQFLISTNNKSKAPLIVFNCADYSYNFQLIYSQLFGYGKGAFTGADREKNGLVEDARDGILFLDEVHRLPPEAQEMLFQLMDRGQYRRLGESKILYNDKVLIICATTENPDSSMLQSFLRRIPVVISIPNLNSRPNQEKIELINHFFYKECSRLHEVLEVTRHVFLCLLFNKYKSNIGELYSTIQIICAKAYLDKMTYNKKSVDINISHIPKQLIESYTANRLGSGEKPDFYPFEIEETLIYDPRQIILKNTSAHGEDKYDYDYYYLIRQKYEELIEKDFSKNDMRNYIEETIESNFHDLFENEIIKFEHNEDIIQKFINPLVYYKVINLIKKIDELSYILDTTNVLYGFMLHIENLINRIRHNRYLRKINTDKVKMQYSEEFSIAQKIKEMIEFEFSILVPEDEIAFLSLFIHSTRPAEISNRVIGVIVICHGKSIATDMASVANTLLGVTHVQALDMPLDMNIIEIKNSVLKLIKSSKNNRGILLLVDMGSLTYIDKLIEEETDIPIKVIDMVSTPIVIEATRKSMMPNMSLDILASDLTSFALTRKSLNMKESIYGGSVFLNKVYNNILLDNFTFLDSKKAVELLMQAFNIIIQHCRIQSTDALVIKFLFHNSSMLERVIRGEELEYYKDKKEILNKNEFIDTIKCSFKIIEQTFGIEIPLSELCYIIEIFLPYYQT